MRLQARAGGGHLGLDLALASRSHPSSQVWLVSCEWGSICRSKVKVGVFVQAIQVKIALIRAFICNLSFHILNICYRKSVNTSYLFYLKFHHLKTQRVDFGSCMKPKTTAWFSVVSRIWAEPQTKQDERENDHLSLRHFKERSVPWRQFMPIISAPIAPACSQITHSNVQIHSSVAPFFFFKIIPHFHILPLLISSLLQCGGSLLRLFQSLFENWATVSETSHEKTTGG